MAENVRGGCLNWVMMILLASLSIGVFAEPVITVKSIMDNEDKEKTQTTSPSQPKDLSAAHKTSTEQAMESSSLYYDEFHRLTPRSAMQAYFKAARARNFELAAKYLDVRNLPLNVQSISPALLAEDLLLVLDRTVWVDIDTLSQSPEGKQNEGVPDYRDLVAQIPTSIGPIQILLQRVPGNNGSPRIWKISNATVSKIPFLIEEFGYNAVGEWLYRHLPQAELLGVMLWQWVYFTATFLGFVFFAVLITRIIAAIIHRLSVHTSADILAFIKGPICLLMAVILARTFNDKANVTLAVVAISQGATVLIIAWVWVFIRAVDILKHRLADRFIMQDKPQAVYLLRPMSNVFKVIIMIMAILIWFENLGFNATTLIAGLGIGGLAIALAAQKTVENIIGAITLYISAPVKIGSLCKFDNHIGTIEEIGLRATRIRTLERSVVYVANAKFVDMQLENISERERISYRPNLMLSAKTQKDDLHAFITAFKQLLTEHEEICNEPCRVKFKGFTPWALQVDVLSYVNTTDFNKYLDVIEELNLAIICLLNKHNCELASPEFVNPSGDLK
ncbi:mechanosensitive ion channel family protein [Pseudoalteromonas sp. KS88]|uniref:mechanosensitive ion channel family protein n=1 Tax=Pseudoalteromonas sp. KS88 TaxID=2109918 RepID=UPI00108176E5|nr:mechanosensitive ion channel family protein [Pseudoalteromonas sp. KS88]TGE84272.1 mechanosensitive ion channel family protein [Pseudoalteromonas sp. KS88]